MREALASDAAGEREQAEQASATAREALEHWRTTLGTELETIISRVQARFPNVPPAASDPAASHAAATAVVRAARERTQSAINTGNSVAKSLADVQVAIRQGQGRIEQIDKELASAQGANRQPAEALTAISSYIRDEHCPTCGRDFSEVSTTPLAAHVSEEVVRLVTAAGRVAALVRDRSTTSNAVLSAQRQEADLLARRLSDEQRDTLKIEQAQLSEWLNALDVLADGAARGSRLLREASQAAQQLSILNSRQSSISGLRAELVSRAEQLSLRPFPSDTPVQQIVNDLIAVVERRVEGETALKKLVSRHSRRLETSPSNAGGLRMRNNDLEKRRRDSEKLRQI